VNKIESNGCSKERQLLFRKGVSALIVNKKNEFLLVNLESFENRFFAIPGGGIEDGESNDDAVYREIQEELGITRQLLEHIGTSREPIQFKFKLYRNDIEYDGSERYFFGFKFTGKESDIKLQEGEIRSYKWVLCDDLKDYLLFDNQLKETQEKLLELFPIVKNSIV